MKTYCKNCTAEIPPLPNGTTPSRIMIEGNGMGLSCTGMNPKRNGPDDRDIYCHKCMLTCMLAWLGNYMVEHVYSRIT